MKMVPLQFKLIFVSVMWFYLFLISSILVCAQPKQGMWRGILILDEKNNIELPFNFEIKQTTKNTQLTIFNGVERIIVNEVIVNKDSFNFKMPIFDSEFKTKLISDSILVGVWINHSRTENNIIQFKAEFGKNYRFNKATQIANIFYDGKWETSFSPNKPDSTKAIGIFTTTKNNTLEGTFLTETGDYRYLEGIVEDEKLYLSCFDGSHAFLFTAETNGKEIINGQFYLGTHWQEEWIAKRNNSFELPDAESLTKLVSPTSKIDFTFLNTDKQKISLSDKRYKNKVVIIQLMGTWCPNCKDETAYFAYVYNQYNSKGLEIISICYERTTDFETSKKNILRLKKQYNLKHQLLITGLSGKEKATQSLPFLTKVMAFPTAIVVDKNHNVVMIHTGFSGPATGIDYAKFKTKFETLITKLLK